jgi:hypothetical protein
VFFCTCKGTDSNTKWTLSRKCRLERLEEGQTITVYVMVFNATLQIFFCCVLLLFQALPSPFSTSWYWNWFIFQYQLKRNVWLLFYIYQNTNLYIFFIGMYSVYPSLLKCIYICILVYGKNDLFFSLHVVLLSVHLHVQKNTIICIG